MHILYKNIKLLYDGTNVSTQGIIEKIGHELTVQCKNQPVEDYFELLKYVIDYIFKSEPEIFANQTFAYFSWILKFVQSSSKGFSIWEAEEKGHDYVVGADSAIKILKLQKAICSQHNVTPIYPRFDQNIVISKGVYEGLPVDGIRYADPEHMTGWWLTTKLYDDNIESLINVHYYHVAFQRPELLPFLALPPGYRFFISSEKKAAWFDQELLKAGNKSGNVSN